MQLLDPHHRFKSLSGTHGTLHHSGRVNFSWFEIIQKIENENFPENIRGNFAFIYIPFEHKKNFIAVVDHLTSVPLFISSHFCSSHFATLAEKEKTIKDFEYDKEFYWESQLFWGYTASDRTTLTSIKRIPPGHKWQNGKATKYLDLNQHIDTQKLSNAEFTETLERVIKREMGSMNGLLASGGTDSATLMAIVSKLKLQKKFRIMSVRSNIEIQNEKLLIDKLAKKINLEINYFDAPTLSVGKNKNSSDIPSEMFLWKDYSFLYRKMAVAHFDNQDLNCVFTGECGDQLFGGPKLAKQIPFLLQNKNWSSRDIAKQYINLSMRESALEWQGYQSSSLIEWYKTVDPDKNTFNRVYEETIERIANFFDSMDTTDLLNRLLNINLVFKGPYRLFHYSQDACYFSHPFADWEIVALSLRSRSQDKIYNKGRLKEIFYQSYQKHLINEIWEAPKTGTAIPIQKIT